MPRICAGCVLPETFPGTSLDEQGLCNHCRRSESGEVAREPGRERYLRKFLALLDRINAGGAPSSYDVLVAYSGGKDSTYTLDLLRGKYNLRVLALTVDNGFLSERAVRNIKEVTRRLAVDHIFFRPRWDLLRKVFSAAALQELFPRKTIERASTICTACIGLVKAISLKTALEQGIPLISYGWSPGQAPRQSSIMKNNPSFVRMTQQVLLRPLKEVAGEDIGVYFLGEGDFREAERFPYNVHPLAWEPYDEGEVLRKIRRLGWVAPDDTDSNSTNCLLNAFAVAVHLERYGFHPYVWEIANMVRDGYMSRREGYGKIYSAQKGEQVEYARRILGVRVPRVLGKAHPGG